MKNLYFKRNDYFINESGNLCHITDVSYSNGQITYAEIENFKGTEKTIFLGSLEKVIKSGQFSLDVPPMQLVLNDGSVVDVDTNCLFDNEYNTTDQRIHDTGVKKILNDRRYLNFKNLPSEHHQDSKSLCFLHWGSEKPEAIDFITQETADKEGLTLKTWRDGRNSLYGLKGGYHLDLNQSTCGGYYYRASNHGRYGAFDFVYKDGVFYKVSHGYGYRKLNNLNEVVTKAVQKQLKDLFAKYYK